MSVNKPPNLPDNFYDFSRSLQTDAGIALRLGHSNFFLIPFHFIICQSLHHCQYRLQYSIKIYEQLMCPHHKHKIQSSQWTITTTVCGSPLQGCFHANHFCCTVSVTDKWWIWSTGRELLTGENRVLREKPVPVTIFPPQIPQGLTWDWTPVTAGRGMWLISCRDHSMSEKPSGKEVYKHQRWEATEQY